MFANTKAKTPNKFKHVSFKEQVKKNKSVFIVYVILRTLVVGVMVLQILNRDWENVFLCALTLILFTVPSFIQRNWHIEIPNVLEIIILFFIFAAEILGEISSYYVRYPGWDTALHTTTGFLAAAIGFSLVDILNRSDRVKFDLSPLFVSIVAFCFSMTIAVLWEFFEFSMDHFFAMDMQKDTIVHVINSVTLDPTLSNTVISIKGIDDVIVNGTALGLGGYLDIGLLDTMKDMFVNFIGAVVFSFIGYFYIKGRGQGKFAKKFIPTLSSDSLNSEEKDTDKA